MTKKLRLSPYGYTEPINLSPKMMESSKDKGQSSDIEKLKKATSGIQESISGMEETLASAFQGVSYDSESKEIQFTSESGEVVGSIDASDFIKDGMIEDVTYNSETKKLDITFNTDGGSKTISVDLSDLFELQAGDGVYVEGNKIAIKLDEEGESFLTLSENGLKLDGILDAIDEQVSASTEEFASKISEEEERATARENEIIEALDVESQRATAAESELQGKDAELQAKIDSHDAAIVELKAKDEELSSLKADKSELEPLAVKEEVNAELLLKADKSELEPLAVKEDVNAELLLKADKSELESLATKEEVNAVDAKVNAIDLTPYATVETVNAELANKANVTDLTAAVNSLTEKDNELEASISQAAANAVAQVVANAPADLDTLKEVADYIASDKTNAAEIQTKLTELTAKDASQDEVINGKTDKVMNGTNGKALIFNETDGGGTKFEHNDGTWSFAGVNDGGENGIAGQIYALKKNASNKMEGTRIDVTKGAMYYTVGDAGATERLVAENEIAVKGDISSAVASKADADKVYSQEEVDAMLAEKQAKIDEMIVDFKKLKEIVGDLGGAVEYSVPEDGSLTTLLGKSGIIKLTEDVESGTYTGGITSKNITTLNLNGKTITTTANTTTNPSIMARGKQQLTINGSGTINANGHTAIQAYGVDTVINLGGTVFGRPTYVTDRSGGELIYCYQGTINISNGIFRNDGENKTFLLNCYDANYRNGTAKIVVTGGKFYDFDPGNNTAEGENTSFLADGYVSVQSTEEIDGVTHNVYTVKKA